MCVFIMMDIMCCLYLVLYCHLVVNSVRNPQLPSFAQLQFLLAVFVSYVNIKWMNLS